MIYFVSPKLHSPPLWCNAMQCNLCPQCIWFSSLLAQDSCPTNIFYFYFTLLHFHRALSWRCCVKIHYNLNTGGTLVMYHTLCTYLKFADNRVSNTFWFTLYVNFCHKLTNIRYFMTLCSSSSLLNWPPAYFDLFLPLFWELIFWS